MKELADPGLTRYLDTGGGTRIHPVGQECVEARHRRPLQVRRRNVYRWTSEGGGVLPRKPVGWRYPAAGPG